MTEILRDELNNVPSVLPVAAATGITVDSLYRFRRGVQSLRLDLADRVAEYFDVHVVASKKRKG